jgi:hypothetical protein
MSSSSSSSTDQALALALSSGISVPAGHTQGSPFNFSNLITIKASPENYLLWRAQVVSVLRSNLLIGYIDGTFPCPAKTVANPRAGDAGASPVIVNQAYVTWIQQDQAILSAILATSTESVNSMIHRASSAGEAWTMLSNSFSAQSVARLQQIKRQLQRTKKLDLSAATYFNKMRGLADLLASIGKPLEEEELVGYILDGLDSDYDSLVQPSCQTHYDTFVTISCGQSWLASSTAGHPECIS